MAGSGKPEAGRIGEGSFAAPVAGGVDLLVIAGEHSGDEHAAGMVRQARRRQPSLKVAALGGRELERAGAQLLFDLVDSSVVGLFEVLKNYSFFKAVFAETIRWIKAHRPRAVCLVDYPGFNLRLAAALRREGISLKGGGPTRVLYYISPQIWAWKAGRRFEMARDLDALAVIFPFETKTYADTDLPVEFVGHPFVAPGDRAPVRYDPAGPVLLLPGSRRVAVERIFPALLEGFAEFGEREAVVLYPSEGIREVLEQAQGNALGSTRSTSLRRTPGENEAAVGASAVLTSSGTMSMHCALAAIPGAIAYRANPFTYLVGRQLVRVPYLGIANLILGEPMYPEYIQGAAKPAALAAELRQCVDEPARAERTRAWAEELRRQLCVQTGASPGDWLLRRINS